MFFSFPIFEPMGRDRNVRIRESIDHAIEHEAKSHSLRIYVATQIPKLHHAIGLPDSDSPEALIGFLNRYIEHVPDFLDALIDIAQSAGIYPFIEKLIHVAQSYFKHPPDLVGDHQGLLALVDEAYLAHRLMEEVNDRVLMLCGIPLIPMDMSFSNIIVHALLGDEFANQLDIAVHFSMESLFEDFSIDDNAEFKAYVALHKAQGWTELLHEWPCLAGDSSIVLNLEQRPEEANLH